MPVRFIGIFLCPGLQKYLIQISAGDKVSIYPELQDLHPVTRNKDYKYLMKHNMKSSSVKNAVSNVNHFDLFFVFNIYISDLSMLFSHVLPLMLFCMIIQVSYTVFLSGLCIID